MRKDHLPKNWAWCQIDELVETTPKEARDDDMDVGFVPMKELGTKFHSQHGYEVKPWKQVKKGYTQFSDGDVLLARITPCFENGKAGIAQNLPNSKGAGSTEFFVLRPFQEAIVARLLLAYFKTTAFLEEGALAMTGAVGQQRVPKQFVLDRHLPLPPLNEQRRIADKLDTTLAAVEACKQKLNNAAEIIQRFRQSVLAAAVSGKLTREWREERGTEGEWETFTLSELCETISDGDHQAPPKAEQGIPFITISAINEAELDLEKATRFVPESYFEALSPKRRARRRDVLFSVTGSIAIPALVKTDKKFVFQRHIALLRSDTEKILPEYLYYNLLSNEVKEKCFKNATGTAQLTIPLKVLRNIQIKLPSIGEQKEIVSRIYDLYSSATKIELSIEQATQKTNSAIPSLLAKAFRGELVPQDPNDEPASVLLERIKAQREAEAAAKKPAKRGRKKKADAAQLVIPEGIADNHLAKVLEECGALSERALLAASELEPAVFQLQLSKELEGGLIKKTSIDEFDLSAN
ncbi:restriction endonuclease subunit S [Synechococcus sp. UW86]|uniref:restriction endonuclease subunit S n=1 Tax=Synechococcus sp. UW86 TaxID=368491 RepID=UPI000E0FC77A|nr:restriction endonuclease subunit S [Synechococcus sp. UW86]